MHSFEWQQIYRFIRPFTESSRKEVFRDAGFLRPVFQEYHKTLSNVQQALYKVKAINESLESHRGDPRKASRDDVHQVVQGLFEDEAWPVNSLNWLLSLMKSL